MIWHYSDGTTYTMQTRLVTGDGPAAQFLRIKLQDAEDGTLTHETGPVPSLRVRVDLDSLEHVDAMCRSVVQGSRMVVTASPHLDAQPIDPVDATPADDHAIY